MINYTNQPIQIDSRPISELFHYPHLKPPAPDASGKGYKYASLPEILSYLSPLLQNNNCIIKFATEPIEGRWCETAALCRDGEVLLSHSIPLLFPDHGDVRRYGAMLTYVKRYAIHAMLGWPMSTEEDADYEKPS
jgi:hypothetical protein